mmetsp:Transcript_28377/g.55807  ORF Transcript_28377/g.55807 Transcript_28377/m.55807 type:complete len:368 (+) Transcript_28377:22-1125(+)
MGGLSGGPKANKANTPRSELVQQWHVSSMFNTKAKDIEDLWDLYIHRPSAYVLLRILLSLPTWAHLTPNGITFCSLGLGWAGAAVASEGFMGALFPISISSLLRLDLFQLRILSSFLIFLSAVCDCADGQLARATGTGSSWGKFLDGFCDVLVITGNFVFLTVALMYHYGLWGLILGVSASVAVQQGSNFYDKIKSCYCIVTGMPDADEIRSSVDCATLSKELRLATERGDQSRQDLFLMKFAMWYAQGLKLDEELKVLEKDRHPVSIEDRRVTMRIVSFFGPGLQTGIFYVALFVSAFWDGGLLAYGVFMGVGEHAFRYYAYTRAVEHKLTAQKQFFQFDLFIPVLAIAIALYIAMVFGYMPLKSA